MRNLFLKFDSLLSKRQKIIITTIIITLGFIITTHRNIVVFRKYYFIFALGFLAYFLTLWSLGKGMTKVKAFTVIILPLFYTLAFTSFYFLFQHMRWLTRIPAAIFFSLSFYCLILSQNVFHIASDRAIPLYRAASTANFVYTVFTFLLVNSIIFSFEQNFYINGLLFFLISFPLVLQALWATKVGGVTTQIFVYSFIFSLLFAEIGVALSFWSGPPLLLSLYFSAIIYGVLGIVLEVLKDRLNSRVVYEYAFLAIGLFAITFSLASYVGL